MQQVRLFTTTILCICLSVFATANTNTKGFVDVLSSTKDSINLRKQDSLRVALRIPVNDSLLNRDFLTRRKMLFHLNKPHSLEFVFSTKDDLKAIIKNIELFAKQEGDTALGLEVYFMNLNMNLEELAPKIIEQRYIALESLATELKYDWLLVRVRYQLGLFYTRTNRVSKGFISLFKALYIVENDLSDHKKKHDIITHIGLMAYRNEQYQLSKRYFKKAVNNKEYNRLGAYNNLALAYTRLKMLDSANYYFRLAKESAISKNSSEFLIIVNGNIGENLYREGEFEAALPLLVADANYSLSKKSFGNASNALIYLSACYLALDEPIKSEQFMWRAYSAAKKDKELRRMKPIYKQLAKWYAYYGDAKNTLLYSDSLQFVSDRLHLEFDKFSGFEADKLVRLNANELDRLQKQKEQETSKRVLLFLVTSSVFVLVILLLLFLNFRAKKLLKEKSLALTNTQLKERLEDAVSQLNVYIKETQQKALTEKVILTDADWREFLQFFNKVYPSFVISLQQQFPRLSKAEVRFCCLSYLSLSDKEMASMLGVGRASIRVTRGRTRAKLHLKEGGSLETLLLTL